jgi:hypothetical protein
VRGGDPLAGLVVNGAMTLGPAPTGSSGPTTLPEYLTSISKDSLYGGYRAGLNMYGSADNSSPVSDGQSVRRWVANWTAGGWAAEFTQGSSPKRPVYGASRNGKAGIYGDGTDWYLELNSTTVLNRDYTLLLSLWLPRDGFAIYSHNVARLRVNAGTATNAPRIYANNVDNDQATCTVQRAAATSTTCAAKVAINSSGTLHYNTASNLFRQSDAANFSPGTIHELWFVPQLTAEEQRVALGHLI